MLIKIFKLNKFRTAFPKLPSKTQHLTNVPSLTKILPKKDFFWSNKNKENKEQTLHNPTEEVNNSKSKEKIENASPSNEEEEKKSIFALNEANKHIEEKVKKYDFYAYVIANTLPPKYKQNYLAFHAFYVEVLRSRYISKEPSVCRMRLSFWEESLKEIIAGKEVKEPMLIVLKETLKTSPIRKDTLFRMIDFLYFDIERNGEIDTIEDLEIFAENTRSLLLYLSLNLFGIDNRDAFLAASHLGRGIGIVDSLKKMPALLKMNVNQIPGQLVNKYGASLINLWDRHGSIKDQFFDCILECAAYAKKHIEIGRSMKDKLPKNTHIAFLQAVESYEWLLELEKYNFDVFEPSLQKQSTRSVPQKMMEYGRKGEY